MKSIHIFLLILTCVAVLHVNGQEGDSAANISPKMLADFVERLNAKAQSLDDQLSRNTDQYLTRLEKYEAKIQSRLGKIDLEYGRRVRQADIAGQYRSLQNLLSSSSGSLSSSSGAEYFPYMDSVQVLLKYFNADQFKSSPNLFANSRVKAALAQFQQLKTHLSEVEKVSNLIKDRQRAIKEELSKYSRIPGLVQRQFSGYQKQYFYYSQQIREYRQLLNEPDKLTLRVLALFEKSRAFQDFIKQNSAIGSLFSVPSGYAQQGDLTGLQTIDQVKGLVASRASAGGGATAFKDGISTAQQQLGALKEKLNKLGAGSANMEMPNFKPNSQKTKRFLKRVELGTNFQTNRGNGLYPNSLDLGLSFGYKISDKSIAGIGMSYRMGTGKDYQHIQFSNEGIGLRSFFDWRLKGGLFASGGFEYNYQVPFSTLSAVWGFDKWQKSGLVGITKEISLKSSLVKKTRVQLFWDPLSYQNRPQTQPFKFRIGYHF